MSLDPITSKAFRVHGGPHYDELRALGIDPKELLDFSVNTNPYGPCPRVIEAVRRAPIDRYPDPTARAAREVMAGYLRVEADQIALGNGAAELLWTLARTLLRPSATAILVEPTFCEFRAAAVAAGARVREWRAAKSDGFAIELEEVTIVVRAEKAEVVYLCTPNTPTGAGLAASAIAAWADANPHTFVVLDQSFLSLSERFGDAEVPMPENVIRIRSLTKEHAIPGVRIGYLIATAEIVARLEEHRPAWMTSTMAQAAAVAICHERLFVDECRRRILIDRERMSLEVERLGHPVFSSTAGFFLAEVGQARELRRRLLVEHHILVRDCTSFGLPELIRLAARPEADCERLWQALRTEALRC